MINELFDYYNKYGDCDYIGEDVSQIEHMTQAAMIAEDNNESVEVILACFFHDIGHLLQEENIKMNGFGIKHHEKIGARLLRDHGIPEPIPTLVENHVKTKKYKVYKFKEYYNKLSEASKKTLIHQGGKMNEQDAKEFEQDCLFDMSNKVREYDDMAKVVGIKIKPIEYYKNMCIKLLSKL